MRGPLPCPPVDDYTENEQAKVRAMGREIAAQRVGAGLTQEQLGQRIGLNRKSVTRYESGERDATFGTLVDIADALGISISQLVIGAEERARREASRPTDG